LLSAGLCTDLSLQVRISVYSLAAITIICDARGAIKLHASFARSLGVTGLAMFTTAIMQTYLHQLSIFHAQILLHYLALIGFPFFCSCLRHPTSRLVRYSYVAVTFAVEGWMIYRLIDSHSYDGCNAAVNITGGPTIHDLYSAYILAPLTTCLLIGMVAFDVFTAMAGCLEAEIELVWPEWVRLAALVIAGVVWLCFVVMNERYLRSNKLERREHEWSFGQMMSVYMLLLPMLDCVGIVQQLRFRGFGPRCSG